MTEEDDLLRMLQEKLDLTEEKAALAEKFCASPTRKKFLASTFVCPDRGCVLAYVYATPRGTIVQHPGYKLSPTVNAASSNDSGRRVNTVDGNRRWKARSYFTDQAVNITLDCDHVRQLVLSVEEVEDAATRRAGRLRIPGDRLIS